MTRQLRRTILGVAVLSVIALGAWARLGPLPHDLLTAQDDVSTVVVDRHGVPLYEARSDRGARAARLEAASLPPALVHATIAAEDRRFRRHPGIDPVAVVRAVVRNMRAGQVVEGASTITQQVAKLLLAGRGARSRSVLGKVEEAVIALRLESRLSKDEILALYLNLAPYGNQVTGAARASEVYFRVTPSQLTIAQAAFLAALPQRPSAYNPYRNSTAAIARQRRIIATMLDAGAITREEASTASGERLDFGTPHVAFVAPHFVEMVLASQGARRLSRSGRPGRVQTTLDADLQREVGAIIDAHRDDLTRHGAGNVAVVVLANASGEWLAWEGSGDYGDASHGGTINGGLALRQPGSALKPFTYALAFENGDTPASILADVPSSYPTAIEGVVYTPRNYDGSFHGPLRARTALAGSQNVPAVALAARLGVPDVLRFLRSVGFTSFDKTASHYGLGVALGNAEVTLAELVNAYAVLARGGVWMPSRAVHGRSAPLQRRVMSPRAAFWVTDILADDEARAYVFGRGGSLEFPFTVAVKTGTSQAYRDNWTIGYTREVTVGVWVGNFDREPLTGSSGVTGAGPIFHAVMRAAQQHVRGRDAIDEAIVARPADLSEHTICGLSGMRAGEACPLRTREWLPGTSSPLPCNWHHHSEDGLLTLWPEPYRAWAAAKGLLEEESARHLAARATVASRQARGRVNAAPTPHMDEHGPESFAILSPADGATYLIDPTLRADFQRVPLRAVAGRGPIEWRIENRVVATTDPGATEWPLTRGVHRVTARDASGQTAEAQITIK